MRRAGYVLWMAVRDIVGETKFFFAVNLRYMASLISLATPYLMYLLGQQIAIERNKFAVGGEIFIPVMIAVLVYYIRQIANRCGKGSAIPVPEKRFTAVDADGEVTILTSRTSEMLLYMADLEDYLERRGML